MTHVTKKQHYIPQMILKQHYADLKDIQIPERYPYLWQYDKINKSERKIYNVKEICYQKYLYEFKDDNGQAIPETRNCIENLLGKYETAWAITLKNIMKYGKNIKKITLDDWALVFILIAMQIMRMPEMLKFNTQYIQNGMVNVSQNQCEQYAKCISLIPHNVDKIECWMIRQLLALVTTKDIVIGHTDEVFLLNGDRPVLTFSAGTSSFTKASFYFPFDKHYCILMNQPIQQGKNNMRYCDFPKAFVRFLNQQNYQNAGRFFYAGKRISTLVDLE